MTIAPRGKKRVVGIGGLFLKAHNPLKLSKWYSEHLGIKITDNVALFTWSGPGRSRRKGHTVWSVFPANTRYFHNLRQQVMINYRVNNLKRLLEQLRKEGVKVANRVEESRYGKFGWVSDPEGNWMELWEPAKKYSASEKEIPME